MYIVVKLSRIQLPLNTSSVTLANGMDKYQIFHYYYRKLSP